MNNPLSIHSFPRAILHIDGDSFFASCEQAVNPALKGKPVITGKERGIASAVSIEAKKLGIKRGMSIKEIRAICPKIIYVPSDYETYSLFSKRMYSIVRRYTEIVEEYGIDECFAEITGLRRYLRMPYIKIAEKIKNELESELGITFSVGLAPSKVLAKVASKWNKPSGLVSIPGKEAHKFLGKLPVGNVWGIGEQTTRYLSQFGIRTALDFAKHDENWVKDKMTKPHIEIWNELRGNAVLTLETEEKHDYQSISKTKTFTPPSKDRSYILAQLSKNTENACIKARRHGLCAKRLYFLLRTKDYRHEGYELKLNNKTCLPSEIVPLINKHLDLIFDPKILYRSTGVILSDLESNTSRQEDLFGSSATAEKIERIYDAIDKLSEKYGKHAVFLGTSFKAIFGRQYEGDRNESARRKNMIFKGEGVRKRIGIPMLGEVT
jgi:DNA polymerase-4/DNA polymerase V